MKTIYFISALCALIVTDYSANAQSCPSTTPAFISSNPNTYYPGLDTSLPVGAKTITLGPTGSGTSPIAAGDLLLLIQMQGAQINSSNTTSYGDGISGGGSNGYLNNAVMIAGSLEYVVAAAAVPLNGGTLTLTNGTVNKYKNASFGTDGQYRFQLIRVGLYSDLTLSASINAPQWNGTTGGVLVLSATGNLNFNGQKLSAAGAGFRGGGARQLTGGNGGLNTDLVTLSTKNYNASKGEGFAGTPRYINSNGVLLDNGAASEGYPNGSYAAGAPANAGGGGTDGNPSSNDQNSGGGGGANGGTGGRGGNSWSSNLPTGGEPGAVFAQNNASRLVMGGGGGAGTTNNGTGNLAAGFSSSGAAGGGIILVTASTITGTGSIDVSGTSGFLTVLNDGSGGGGAGGSVLLYAGSGWSGITVTANGGNGGTNTGTGSPHGPGGGGGGGVVFSNGTLNAASSVVPGTAGYTALGTTHFNAATGASGIINQQTTEPMVPHQSLYCTLLPLYFETIRAIWEQKNVMISWSVINDNPYVKYTIEKSTDGSHFSAAGETTGHYFTDTKNNNTSVTYYRIKSMTAGGDIIFSSIVSVYPITIETGAYLRISPNPCTGGPVTIHFTSNMLSVTPVTFRMINLNGVAIWQKQINACPGLNTVEMDNTGNIPNGTYFIQYSGSAESAGIKLIVHH